MIDEQRLPANTNAERFVLGSILLQNGLYVQAAGTLNPDDFSLEKHHRIFKRMGDLQERGERIDRVTIANELMKLNELDACGGLSYLVSLDEGMPFVPNVDSYIRIVKDKSLLRRIIFASQNTMDQCLLGQEEPGEILTRSEDQILRLRDEARYTGSHVQFGSDLLSSVLNMASERERRYLETGKPVMGIKTRFRKLDEALNGLNPGLHLLGGGPGMGKTSLSLQISIEACRQGIPVIYVTYENSPGNLVLKAVCARADVSPRAIERGDAHAEDLKRFKAAALELEPFIKPTWRRSKEALAFRWAMSTQKSWMFCAPQARASAA